MNTSEPHRVFVAEDEFLVALQIEEDLVAAGYAVVGPFTTLSASMAASRTEVYEVATLDLNLRGELGYPLVDELVERNVPVLLLTGYAKSDLPERYRTLPCLTKPFDATSLIRNIRNLLAAQ